MKRYYQVPRVQVLCMEPAAMIAGSPGSGLSVYTDGSGSGTNRAGGGFTELSERRALGGDNMWSNMQE
ncbi:MAG: hypothetical protein ACI353_01315 [Alloprevotella sp.]